MLFIDSLGFIAEDEIDKHRLGFTQYKYYYLPSVLTSASGLNENCTNTVFGFFRNFIYPGCTIWLMAIFRCNPDVI